VSSDTGGLGDGMRLPTWSNAGRSMRAPQQSVCRTEGPTRVVERLHAVANLPARAWACATPHRRLMARHVVVLYSFGFSTEAMFPKAVEIKTGIATLASKSPDAAARQGFSIKDPGGFIKDPILAMGSAWR